ncbi:hypothetical protein G4B88_025047 [Cannabis sativa]|uniref:Uncharacterized protein n=1 Tax=Cannabis sativa TaxID=3483 RepID=A0A7J6DQB4_CANSA|nr:hypothetical protein G4B88_025047 [Cannabis sativa]
MEKLREVKGKIKELITVDSKIGSALLLKIYSSHYFEAILVSDGKSLVELTSLSIIDCGSFVSFPNGGLIAPKLSDFSILNCLN